MIHMVFTVFMSNILHISLETCLFPGVAQNDRPAGVVVLVQSFSYRFVWFICVERWSWTMRSKTHKQLEKRQGVISWFLLCKCWFASTFRPQKRKICKISKHINSMQAIEIRRNRMGIVFRTRHQLTHGFGEAASLAAELKLRKSWAAQETEELEALRSGRFKNSRYILA